MAGTFSEAGSGHNPGVLGRKGFGVGGGIRTHDSRSHSPEFYH